MAEPIYRNNRPIHAAHRRRYYRRSLLLLIVILIFSAATAAVMYDLRRATHDDSKKQIGATYEQHIAGQQVFRSSFFQFSDSSKWSYAPGDSTASKLTYLLYVSGLPAHSLTVYINQTPLQYELAVTRVLPVHLKEGNAFTPGSISDHCNTQYKATDLKRIQLTSLSGTRMLCVPDSPQFSVIVGQVGSDYNLSLKRSNGEVAHYIIIYRNLTVNPDPAPFIRIMQTFQSL